MLITFTPSPPLSPSISLPLQTQGTPFPEVLLTIDPLTPTGLPIGHRF